MPQGGGETRPADLRDYAQILWRRKWYVVLAVIVAVGASLAVAKKSAKLYSASAQVLVPSNSGGSDSNSISTEIAILESGAVQQVVSKTLPDTGTVTASQVGESALISVTSEAAEAKLAAKQANAWASAYVQYRQAQERNAVLASNGILEQQIATLQQQINQLDGQLQSLPTTGSVQAEVQTRRNSLVDQQSALQAQINQAEAQTPGATLAPAILTAAVPPSKPTGTSLPQAGIEGLGAGLLVGVALAFLFEYLDDSITVREQLEAELGGEVPVLGSIPEWTRRRDVRAPAVPALAEPTSAAAESYRALRTSLHFTGADAPGSLIEVVASSTGEGSSSIASNLAVLMARAGRRVVLVDADLRRPRLHRYFGLDNRVGLTSVLIGDVPLSEALQTVPGLDRLAVLPAGPVPPNPSELLASPAFSESMSSLKEKGAAVIVDTAPLLAVSDGLVVAAIAKAVVLVTSARDGKRKRIRRAVSLLQQSNAPLVGAVLNRTGKLEVLYGTGGEGDIGSGEHVAGRVAGV